MRGRPGDLPLRGGRGRPFADLGAPCIHFKRFLRRATISGPPSPGWFFFLPHQRLGRGLAGRQPHARYWSLPDSAASAPLAPFAVRLFCYLPPLRILHQSLSPSIFRSTGRFFPMRKGRRPNVEKRTVDSRASRYRRTPEIPKDRATPVPKLTRTDRPGLPTRGFQHGAHQLRRNLILYSAASSRCRNLFSLEAASMSNYVKILYISSARHPDATIRPLPPI